MRIGVLKEYEDESRVAFTPETVKKWSSKVEILVERGAGEKSFFTDEEYISSGAKIVDREEIFRSDIILKVQKPIDSEIERIKEGAILICFLQPLYDPQIAKKLVDRKITSFALEFVPRITRAQVMDALSSQATVAGYKAVLIAANLIPRFFPMLMTAAGTIKPAKVLVIGAGVAGLQAIATARRLGAQVKAVDTRPVVKGEVESLGATFVPMEVKHEEAQDKYGYAKELPEEYYKKEQEIISEHIKDVDVVITTAQIPGRPAPKLITENMVKMMKRGSVIVDLAVDTGGNCTISEKGKVVEKYGVKIVGFSNAPSSLPQNASEMLSRNISSFLQEIIKDGKININLENEIIREMILTHNGNILNERVKKLLEKSLD